MVKLKNSGCDTFYAFVLANLGTVKEQQIDMVMDCVDLTKLNDNKDFFVSLYEGLALKIDEAGFRAQLRFEMLAQLLGKRTETKDE